MGIYKVGQKVRVLGLVNEDRQSAIHEGFLRDVGEFPQIGTVSNVTGGNGENCICFPRTSINSLGHDYVLYHPEWFSKIEIVDEKDL